jgi:VanZ family protein
MTAEPPLLRWLPLWLATGWLLVASIIYLSLTPAPPSVDLPEGDKLEHVLAYAVLMFWFAQMYYRTRSRLPFALGFVLLGIALEFLQAFTDTRQFEIADMIADAAGVALGWIIAPPRTGNVLRGLESLVLKAD